MRIDLEDKIVLFSKNTINSIIEISNQYKNKKLKKEVGGVILAQTRENIIYITELTSPNNNDKSGINYFFRSKRNINKVIQKKFNDSQSKTIYIGEWHSHLENHPTPSNQDIRMIKEQYEKNEMMIKYIILIIIGIEKVYLGLYNGAEMQKTHLEINELFRM